MKHVLLVALAALGASLGGCYAFSERHPTTESRYMAPAEDAFWVDRRSRHDKADVWAREIDRQSAVRLARDFGN